MNEFLGSSNLKICPCKLYASEKNLNNKDPYIYPTLPTQSFLQNQEVLLIDKSHSA